MVFFRENLVIFKKKKDLRVPCPLPSIEIFNKGTLKKRKKKNDKKYIPVNPDNRLTDILRAR